jgi:hypothetical protein
MINNSRFTTKPVLIDSLRDYTVSITEDAESAQVHGERSKSEGAQDQKERPSRMMGEPLLGKGLFITLPLP